MMTNNNQIFRSDIDLGNKQISDQEFKDILYQKLTEVLKKVFPDNIEKQRIKVAPDRFQFACPFCRDSSKSNKKKRGNFIFKEGAFYNCYKCFNCGSYMPIRKFFREFDIVLPMGAVSYIASHKNAMRVENVKVISNFHNELFNADKLEQLAIDKSWLIQKYGCEYISIYSRGGKYLMERCINNFDNFLYDKKNDAILILNQIKEKIISFQIRPLKQKKYITVSLRMIHEKLLRDGVTVPDDLESLSMIYNLYNINPNQPLLATEGPIDSMFLPNCIALLGASKNVNIGLPLWYVYDSDSKGKTEAIKKLKSGNHVFMWDKLKSEYNLPIQSKWDINDFIIWCQKNNKPIPKFWQSYFTNDAISGILMI